MHRTTGKHEWGDAFTIRRTVQQRALVAAFGVILGFGLIDCVYRLTHHYFAAIGVVIITFVALYGGLFLGLGAAIILCLAGDCGFLQPNWSIPRSLDAILHLIVSLGVAVLASCLGAGLRSSLLRIRNAQKEAELASAAMENALALVAHDIRNPLTAIKLSCQTMMRNTEISAQQKTVLLRLLNRVDQTDVMLQSLLDVERLRAGGAIPLEFTTCDLSAYLEQTIEQMSDGERSRILYSAEGPMIGAWGLGGIRRCLENLVSNAIKYGLKDAPIQVKLVRRDGDAVLSVHNQRSGTESLENCDLFGLFERSSRAESSRVTGWGVGLALVKGVAEAHGGRVKSANGPGNETVFTVSLPIREVASARAAGAS